MVCAAALLGVGQVSKFPEPPRPPGLPNPPHIFALGQNYPVVLHVSTGLPPWHQHDFRTQPGPYMAAVLKYVLEGNVGPGIAPEDEWPGAANKVRPWYNVPWANREYIHGLTEERTGECGQLVKTGQKYRYTSWGVGFYNEPGGYTVGKVFPSATNYSSSAIAFPNDTVAIKVLFSTAPVTVVPYLKGTREWTAFLPVNPVEGKPGCAAYPSPCTIPGVGCTCATVGTTMHCNQKVHLLQLDIAVKDTRAGTATGWVFGTFVYNGQASGASPYDRLRPVGLAWGSDPPNVTPPGGFKEQYLFPNNPVIQLGVGGRLNGMIDDPTSWCLGCHSAAEAEPPNPPLSAAALLALGDIKCGTPQTKGGIALDYSLSIYDSIYHFLQMQQSGPSPSNIPGTVKGPTGKPIYPIKR